MDFHGDGSSLILRIILGWITLHVVAGQINIEMGHRQMPKTGQQMSLICRVSRRRQVTRDCHMYWSQTTFNNNNSSSSSSDSRTGQNRFLQTGHRVKIMRYVDRKNRLVKSQLIIRNMSKSYDGLYTCTLMCPNIQESAAVLIKVQGGFFGGYPDRSQLLGTLIPVGAVILVLAVSFVMALRRGTRPHQVAPQAEFIFPDGGSQEDLIGPTLADLPPRYSVIVPNGRAQDAGVNPAYEPEVSPDTVQPPPPDYTQAVLDLAEKGIVLNPESLLPAPPAYTESQPTQVVTQPTQGSET